MNQLVIALILCFQFGAHAQTTTTKDFLTATRISPNDVLLARVQASPSGYQVIHLEAAELPANQQMNNQKFELPKNSVSQNFEAQLNAKKPQNFTLFLGQMDPLTTQYCSHSTDPKGCFSQQIIDHINLGYRSQF